MLTELHRSLDGLPAETHIIDVLLPKVVKALSDEFTHWVDGGSGIGVTSKTYAKMLGSGGRVYCYDPLPENYRAMQAALIGPEYVLRNVALSDKAGEATFVIPQRAGPGGDWPSGTSWAGSLKFPSEGKETVTVQTVRLEDEPIPRFDFVKLDLQGGELDAMHGMGDRIEEAKVIYAECQLLNTWQNSVGYLKERGFDPYFDRIQFGMKADARWMPFELMRKIGLNVDRLYLPDASGIPLVGWAHFMHDKAIDPATFVFKEEAAAELRDAGVLYMQTDIIAINARHWKSIGPLLN